MIRHDWMEGMRPRLLSALLIAMALMPGSKAYAADATDPVKIAVKDLGFPLPIAIVNKAKIARLEYQERQAEIDKIPGVPKSSQEPGEENYHDIAVFKASDGLIYCTDSDFAGMALWVRRGDTWVCQVSNLTVRKTFGGVLPWLPVRYLGKGFFAFASTCPGDVEKSPDSQFPQAKAITYLLNSESGEILERSESYLYDHNPHIQTPAEWYPKYGLKPAISKSE